MIENFDMEDHRCLEAIKKNKNILIGNVGKVGSNFVENTDFYKELDLFVNRT